MRKRGKAKDKGKQLGVIIRFNEEGMPVEGGSESEGEEGEQKDGYGEEDQGEDQKAMKEMPNGSYVYLGKRKQYGLIRSKKSDSNLLVKIKTKDIKEGQFSTVPPGFEEIEVNLSEEDVRLQVEVPIRVVISEDKRFTLTLRRPANDKLKVLAEEVGDLLGLSKYALTFFYKGDKVGLNERLGDREIGGPFANSIQPSGNICPQNPLSPLPLLRQDTSAANEDYNLITNSSKMIPLTPESNQNYLLCLKGGSEGPKSWKRFLHVDDPCRQLSYISDEEAFDAISYVPKNDILFAGFSVFHVASTDIDFKVIYKYKIGTECSSELTAEFSQSDVEKKMCDIMLDQEIHVSANKAVTIMVRFQAGEEYFCSTLLGYGGENFASVAEN